MPEFPRTSPPCLRGEVFSYALRRQKQSHTIESFAAEDAFIMAMPEFQQLCNEAKKEIQEIDAQQLRRMQQASEDFVLIDVREPNEVQQGSIPGAVPIPRGVLELNIDQVTTDKNKKIVLYCGGGSRSALAAWMLKKMGFKHPISLLGGYRGWTQG